MPIIYSSKIRKALRSIDLTALLTEIETLGYEFEREGHFDKNKEPFQFCNYLFYIHPETKMRLRIGYDYGIIETKETSKDLIFEICWAIGRNGWYDVTPDFRKECWRKISCMYMNFN